MRISRLVCREQTRIVASFIRGGTSKALFFHEKDLPPPGDLRDKVLKRAMGTPDKLQIDGMGGGNLSTSKVAIIKTSSRPGVDVDYSFMQIGTGEDLALFGTNCGNISAAVGPFAIDEGLVREFRPGIQQEGQRTQQVKIWCTGPKRMITASVPIDETGLSVSQGDFQIAGVPGTGARILLNWKDTIGGACNKGLLPTGNAVDTISLNGKPVNITFCDVGNLCLFVAAEELGLKGDESAEELDTTYASMFDNLVKTAAALGVEEANTYCFVIIVSKSTTGAEIRTRAIRKLKAHHSMPGTGCVCTAACSRIEGSVVNGFMDDDSLSKGTFTVQHPSGAVPIWIETEKKPSVLEFKTLAIARTSRRIMDGVVYIPKSVWNGQ